MFDNLLHLPAQLVQQVLLFAVRLRLMAVGAIGEGLAQLALMTLPPI